MKKLNKFIKVFFVFFISLLLICIMFIISAPIINNYSANKVKKELCNIPLPSNTEIIESTSDAGKLSGCGNGMQYFGAILIKSDLSLKELKDYYSQYKKSVDIQTKQEISKVENKSLKFLNIIDPSENYYIVYSWGNGISPFNEFDIRGH